MGERPKLPNIGKAVEGAIQGVKKTGLPDAAKADLKAFYQEHKI